jgi:hypothetical protein
MHDDRVPKSAGNFEQFWKEYLLDLAESGTRALHFLGTGVGIMALIIGLITFTPLIAILGIGLGYLLAWSGHLLIEGNRPPCFAIRCGHCCATYACFAFG